jgi:hypothetical protein
MTNNSEFQSGTAQTAVSTTAADVDNFRRSQHPPLAIAAITVAALDRLRPPKALTVQPETVSDCLTVLIPPPTLLFFLR